MECKYRIPIRNKRELRFHYPESHIHIRHNTPRKQRMSGIYIQKGKPESKKGFFSITAPIQI